MPKSSKSLPENPERRKLRPAITEEGRQAQMVSLAYDLAERRLMEGTATSQEILHFLKLGTVREELELEKLKKENRLLEEKASAIQAEKERGELFAQAIAAMKSYTRTSDSEDED